MPRMAFLRFYVLSMMKVGSTAVLDGVIVYNNKNKLF